MKPVKIEPGKMYKFKLSKNCNIALCGSETLKHKFHEIISDTDERIRDFLKIDSNRPVYFTARVVKIENSEIAGGHKKIIVKDIKEIVKI